MCCGLKDDLLKEIAEIAKSGKFDVLFVEGSGVAEPMPVAEGISNFDIERGKTLDSIIHLDTVVTVVDTPNFLENYNSQQSIAEQPTSITPAREIARPWCRSWSSRLSSPMSSCSTNAPRCPRGAGRCRGDRRGSQPGRQGLQDQLLGAVPDRRPPDLFEADAAEDLPGWVSLQTRGGCRKWRRAT